MSSDAQQSSNPPPAGMRASPSSTHGEPSTSASAASVSAEDGAISSGSGSTAVQKRGRKSRPKVKTGCSNCKQRRIKCDEKRPACTQCVRSRKDCTGYPPPSRHSMPYEEIRIAPKPAPALALQSAGPPSGTTPSGQSSAPFNPIGSMLQKPTVLPPRRANRRVPAAAAGLPLASSPISYSSSPGAAVATPGPGPASLSRPPYASASHSPLTSYSPSPTLPLQEIEGHYFELFRTQTASELAGYFDSVFWTQRVLQECQSSAAIRHAAVALGALYKTLEQSTKSPSPAASDSGHSSGSTPSADAVQSHWQVAVKQYSEACKAMMLLDNTQSQQTNRTRLMASVLLVSFDAFIGDHKQAIIQLQSGLSLLERIQTQHAQQGGDPIDQELVVTFTRLAIQAKSYDLAFHFPEPYVIRLTPDAPDRVAAPYSEKKSIFSALTDASGPSLDQPFSSVRDARLAFDRLCAGGMRFLERLHLAKQGGSEGPSRVFPDSWKHYGMGFLEDITAWSRAFDPIYRSRHEPGRPHLERAGVAALKMSQLNCAMLFMSLFNSTETQFDGFMQYFQEIVELGDEIVSADERRAVALRCPHPEFCPHRAAGDPGAAAWHIKPSFSADLGIVPPLFVVATKCREPMLRRRSIQLLRSSSRREGMWDSALAARIGQYIMDLEEYEGPSGPSGAASSSSPLSHQHGGFAPAYPQQQQASTMGDTYMGDAPMIDPLLSAPRVIPEERRVMIRSVDFDLRARFADLTVGTRGAQFQSADHDTRYRETHITW